MKALSLWQPWASAITLGLKRIETRSWRTNYRGRLLIHAAKKKLTNDEYVELAYLSAYQDVARLARPDLKGQGIAIARIFHSHLPYGALIAVCDLVGWQRFDPSTLPGSTIRGSGHQIPLTEQEYALGNYGPGRFGWILSNIRALSKPIPYKGRQGLFEVPDDQLPEEVMKLVA